MFKFLIKVLAFSYTIFLTISCSPKTGMYNNLLAGIKSNPALLNLHRDSVRFVMGGAIPLEYLTKDAKIYLYPEYKYANRTLQLGEFIPFDATYSKGIIDAKVNETIIFPFLPGMESGELVLKGLVEKKKGIFQSPEKVIAEGLEITPLLTRYQQVLPDQPIPSIGVYILREFQEANRTEIREFYVPFDLGRAQRPEPAFPVLLKDYLIQGEPGMKVKKVVVTGLTSPEQKDNVTGLAKNRADFFAERLKTNRSLKTVPLESMYRSGDWFDLRQLLSDYEGISSEDKDDIYEVLLNQESFASQLRNLQALSSFNKISRDLFPKLRAAKVTFELENTRFNDLEIAASVFALLNGNEPLEGFEQSHLIYAAQNVKKLEEKKALYQKLSEMYPSEMAFNNLGVVYLNLAQRELDVRNKNIFISEALTNLRRANQIQSNSISFHNIGRAYILRGDFFEAYIAISEASALEQDESSDFLNYNEGLRGALDILNGDYRLATIRFSKANEDEVTFFNRGLAYFLAQDYRLASESFESSVQADRGAGFGFYGLALIAAVNGDKEGMIENLGKSIETSEFLKEKALEDINFKNYRSELEFIDLFR